MSTGPFLSPATPSSNTRSPKPQRAGGRQSPVPDRRSLNSQLRPTRRTHVQPLAIVECPLATRGLAPNMQSCRHIPSRESGDRREPWAKPTYPGPRTSSNRESGDRASAAALAAFDLGQQSHPWVSPTAICRHRSRGEEVSISLRSRDQAPAWDRGSRVSLARALTRQCSVVRRREGQSRVASRSQHWRPRATASGTHFSRLTRLRVSRCQWHPARTWKG